MARGARLACRDNGSKRLDFDISNVYLVCIEASDALASRSIVFPPRASRLLHAEIMNPHTQDLSRALPDSLKQLKRVRHETRRRDLTVAAVENLTPGMRRVRLQSPELADFVSLSPDDHIKLFFPAADGTAAMRDYTPRAFDPLLGSLTIDFALHGEGQEAGPATAWALAAKPGDTLQIGGPRGSTIIPDVFDWYLLVGDETALPAIGRRLEELRPAAVVKTVVAVDSAAEIQSIKSPARWDATWIRRDTDGSDDAANARRAIDRAMPTSGEGFVWIAGEAQFARTLRAHLIEVRGHPAARMKAAGYWIRGDAGGYISLD